MKITENMIWPPQTYLGSKMQEHSAWYSGDAEVIANYYHDVETKDLKGLPYNLLNEDMFWGRQITNQGEICVHVPIAGDISETSANFLFGEAPLVKIAQAHEQKAALSYKESQKELDKMLTGSMFFTRLLEAAETSSALGGVFIKIAWDKELSPYPIPSVVQPDRAIPEFKFGMLRAVTFWRIVDYDKSGEKVYRLLERYEMGKIINELYFGTKDRLGSKVSLSSCEDTNGLAEVVDLPDALFAVYVPNMLPNRLERNSYLGRSDYSGLEGMMDSLDEAYSLWVREIAIAQGKILLPESFIENKTNGRKFNYDRMVYVGLDADPIADHEIKDIQFQIRAAEFEQTCLNFMERIITSAGYSPQSFGLNISGRAESGTALSMRERKSFATKGKKQQYWQGELEKLVKLMMMAYNDELGGKLDIDVDINVSFSDSITNNITELSAAAQALFSAQSASIETRVRMLHPEWDEEQILSEVDRIKEENSVGMQNPDGLDIQNPDYTQVDDLNNEEEEPEE